MKDLNTNITKVRATPGFKGYIVLTADSIPISLCNVSEEEAGNFPS